MSLLVNQSYANPSRPLWASVDASGGGVGPTGPAGPTGPTGATGPTGGGGNVLSQTLLFQTPSNGGGPAFTFSWTDRPFNTGSPALDLSGNSTVISGLSLNLSNSEITVPTGTYVYSGFASTTMTVAQARLAFITPSRTTVPGATTGTDDRTFPCPFQGTLTGPAVFTVQTNGQVSRGNDEDFGINGGFGDNIFAAITLTKIA